MPTRDPEAPPGPVRPLLTLADVGKRTGLSVAKLRRDIRSRKLACLRFGRAIRVPEETYKVHLRRHQ